MNDKCSSMAAFGMAFIAKPSTIIIVTVIVSVEIVVYTFAVARGIMRPYGDRICIYVRFSSGSGIRLFFIL